MTEFLAAAGQALLARRPSLVDPFPTPGALYEAVVPGARRAPMLDLVDEHLVAVAEGELDRLIVTTPPQVGKSERISRAFPLWWLLRRPSARVVLASYEAEIAARWGRQVRTDIVGNDGTDGTLDLGLRVRRDTAAAQRWQLEGHRGGMTTVGVGSALTGRPADLLIVDDPVKDARHARSRLLREQNWQWWQNVARTRLAPGAPVIVVQTRWHEDDLAGRLLAERGSRWRVLNIPAVAGDGDPLGREPGEWLQTARGTSPADWEDLRADLDPFSWAAMFLGRPAPAEGGLFERKAFRWWHPSPLGRNVITLPGDWRTWDVRGDCWVFAVADLAASIRSSADWSVCQVWAVAPSGDRFLVDQVRVQVRPAQHWDAVRGLLSRWGAPPLFVEGSQFGTDLVRGATREGVHVQAVHADADKWTRALPAARRVQQGRVWLPAHEPWAEELVEELCAFPNDAHDDQVDCVSYADRVAEYHFVPPGTGGRSPRGDDGGGVGAGFDAVFDGAFEPPLDYDTAMW